MDPTTTTADDDALPPSQSSSHFPLLEPVSGATLFELEVARRRRNTGKLRIGCKEVDDAVLLGGFERGAVVGVSSEVGDVGLVVGLQTVAHAMVFADEEQQQQTGGVDTSRRKPRAAIITTLAATAVLPTLRDVIRAQVLVKLGPAANHRLEEVNAEVRRCLERISVSRVFDVEGLWEVVSELETQVSQAPTSSPPVVTATGEGEEGGHSTIDTVLLPAPSERSKREDSPKRSVEKDDKAKPRIPPLRPPKPKQIEVGDSEEDEDEELSSSSPLSSLPEQSPSPPPPNMTSSPSPPPAISSIPIPTEESKPPDIEDTSQIPDIILITNFSSLLTNLFTRSADKADAHTTLQLLSSHLRYLARSASGPLIMLLNTTTASFPATNTNSTNNTANPTTETAKRPLEPTLCSIFNSAPDAGGRGEGRRHNNKPSFGTTFAQFLDLHVLCTRVPRMRSDAEVLFAPGTAGGFGEVKYCWVVEVLLDELGVLEWEDDVKNLSGGKDKGKGIYDKTMQRDKKWTRRSREQRWGAVDIRGGVRIVDAFPGGWQDTKPKGPVRLAAGFGGPPPRGL
ncbi:uncharacterized protein F4822DRAFT_389558 [Hypoxylon trugodes]|uniref:uncharacterized protein n=1 Tax=Hypoxylon trugodes TaxID=326681 RepID=UPI00219904E4|nr:uncharacterized protein F4822DRAFT_389558 [Hypoxylon trugodes]KAI1392074.1 hypothetical protein F4822DRAFT_389558 [Hypoxylon trugodes]